MSFLMFGVKFDGSKDSFEEGSKKMDEVCLKIGVLFLREWFDYWIKEGKVEKGNVKDYYKCIKVLEDNIENIFKDEKGEIWK